MAKILFDVNIDYYENGQGIIIKRRKDKRVWSRVFSNNGAGPKNAQEWINEITSNKGEKQ